MDLTQYNELVALLERKDPENKKLSILKSGKSSFTVGMLQKEMERLKPVPVKQELKTPSQSPEIAEYVRQHESKYVRIDFSALPIELKERDKKRQALFKQAMEAYHRMVHEAKTDQERGGFASLIISNFELIQKIWKEIEDFQINGTRPTPENIESNEELTALELANMRDNLKKNLYRLKQQPDKSDKAKATETEIKRIEELLHTR